MNKRDFKEKIRNNSGRTVQGIKNNKMIEVVLKNDLLVKVDRGIIRANDNEIKLIVGDLFTTKSNVKEKQIIKLSDVCDTNYNMVIDSIYNNKEKNIISIKLC